MNGEPVSVRRRKRPIEILFNLNHPDGPPVDITEVEGRPRVSRFGAGGR